MGEVASGTGAVDQAVVTRGPGGLLVRAGHAPLIGRAAESAQLRTKVVEAFAGRPRAVFLAGKQASASPDS